MISLLLSNMCIQNPRNPAKCRENRACEATTNRCYCRYYCCLSVTSQSYFPFPRFLKSFGSKSARVQLQNIERSDVCSGKRVAPITPIHYLDSQTRLGKTDFVLVSSRTFICFPARCNVLVWGYFVRLARETVLTRTAQYSVWLKFEFFFCLLLFSHNNPITFSGK